MVLIEALASRLQDLYTELQRDAPIDVRVQALLILLIGIVLTVVVPYFDELSKKGSEDQAPSSQEDWSPPAVKRPVAEEPSPRAQAPARAGPAADSLGAKGRTVEPLFTFEGCTFDGDRIVNIRENPYGFTQQLGGAISIAFTARWDAFQLRSRILDFGNGPGVDNIVIGNLEKGRTLLVEVFRGPSKKRMIMTGVLALGETHSYLLSISETGHMRMMQDGTQIGVQPQGFAPRAVERQKLLIGGSNSTGDENFEGDIRNLRIWRGEVSWLEAYSDQPAGPPAPARPAAPKECEKQDDMPPEKDGEEAPEADVAEEEFAEAEAEVEVEEIPEPRPIAEPAEEAPEAPEAADAGEDGWTMAKPTRKADRKSRGAAEPLKPSGSRSAKADREPRERKEPPPAPKAEKTPPRAPAPAPASPAPVALSPPETSAAEPQELEEKVEKAAELAPTPEKPTKAEKAAPKKRGGKAWADIPPEGTPPPSPQPTELALSAKATANYSATGEPESGMMPINEDADDNFDDGFEFLVGKKRKPKARPAEAVARTSRSGSSWSHNVQTCERHVACWCDSASDTRGSAPAVVEVPQAPKEDIAVSVTEDAKGPEEPLQQESFAQEDKEEKEKASQPSQPAPSSLSPLEKELMRMEKKQREVEKLKQRHSEGQELDTLQMEKLQKGPEIARKIAELQLKKALQTATTFSERQDTASPEPWDHQVSQQPFAEDQSAGAVASVGRTPLKAPRETPLWRPNPGTEPSASMMMTGGYGPNGFGPGPTGEAMPFQGMSSMQPMQPMEMVMPDAPAPASEDTWDVCWEWVQNGFCPRGETCRWQHPPLQLPNGNILFWQGNEGAPGSEMLVAMAVPAGDFGAMPCNGGTPNFNGPYSGDHVAFVGCQGACGCCGGCCACGGPGCGCMPCGGCCGCPPGCGEQACVGCAPCGPCPCTPCGCEGSCVGCGSCAVCGGCMPGSGPCGPGCPGCGPGGPCGPGPCGPCGCSNGCGLQPCGVPNVSDSPTFEGRKEDGSPAAR